MKYSFVLAVLLSAASLVAATESEMKTTTVSTPTNSTISVVCPSGNCEMHKSHSNVVPLQVQSAVLENDKKLRIGVVGQGVAPMNTSSPAQAYALAKRAATADAYRLIAEKVKGVYVEGQDLVQNMMVKRSSVRTSVSAMVKNANVVETTFKEGLCEVEMEITLSHSQFPQ